MSRAAEEIADHLEDMVEVLRIVDIHVHGELAVFAGEER